MKSVANSSTLWKQFTETDCRPVCRPGQGHKKARESVQDRYLRLLAERDRSMRVTQLSCNMSIHFMDNSLPEI
ncbi:hypothetical protein TNCV_3974271 [Trichonephila clavipes]|nr:hypothetical protein TNCV_3974271 [Trichonephila clavipes]